MSAHRDFLTSIAEKERRCFELREELRLEELELKRLQTAWQSTVARELAYGSIGSSATSPPAHRRSMSSSTFSERSMRSSHHRGESSDSIPQVAAEAWNSLSAKLPGSLKNGLTNLFDQMAVNAGGAERREEEDAMLPEPPQKAGGLAPPSLKGAGDSLTIGTGRSLTVLEEEASENGSTTPAARSPRSPRPPPQALEESGATSKSSEAREGDRKQQQQQQLARGPRLPDFAASRTPPLSQRGSSFDEQDEAGPSTPPKSEAIVTNTPSRSSLWQSKRSSVLGSLSNFQKQVFNSPSSPSSPGLPGRERRGRFSMDSHDGQSPTAPSGSGWGLGGTWAKKLKEARENASDMLKEAERKLGNAMTIDELLGLPPSSSASSLGSDGRERDVLDHVSSSITADSGGRDRDAGSSNLLWKKMQASKLQAESERVSISSRPEDSPWYAAAGGTARSRSSNLGSPSFVTSPSLDPPVDPRRLSMASSRSSASYRSDPDRRRSMSSHSPLAFQEGASSPVALGVMGSGILGLISQAWSPEERPQDGDADDGQGGGHLGVSNARPSQGRGRSGGSRSPTSGASAAGKRTSMLSDIGDRMGNDAASSGRGGTSPSLSNGNGWEWGSDAGWGEVASPNGNPAAAQNAGGIRLSLIDVDQDSTQYHDRAAKPPQTPTLPSDAAINGESATPRQDKDRD
ncbi:hypothetical protein ACQY0O_000987 [Thecaphora frezii]